METKRLGTSDLRVSEIGLGTWRYTGGVDPLQAGICSGANLIDTAEIYGTEEIVGKAIRGRRDQVVLATKVAPRHFRSRDLITAADNSLRRLGTDYIDLYQLHWPNYTVPIAETMAAMERLVDAGKIRFIGVSNFSVGELKVAQGALRDNRIVSNQVRYSLIDRSVEGGLLEYCHQNGITVIAYSPLGMSLALMNAADSAGVLAQTAKRSGKTDAQVALNWLVARDNVLAIPKASTVMHAIDDCGSSGWRLSTGDYERLETNIRCHRRGQIGQALARSKRRLAQMLGRAL